MSRLRKKQPRRSQEALSLSTMLKDVFWCEEEIQRSCRDADSLQSSRSTSSILVGGCANNASKLAKSTKAALCTHQAHDTEGHTHLAHSVQQAALYDLNLSLSLPKKLLRLFFLASPAGLEVPVVVEVRVLSGVSLNKLLCGRAF